MRGESHKEGQPSRRGWIAEHVLVPVLVSFVTALITVALTAQFRERHDLSITILPSADAAPIPTDPFTDPFTGEGPTPTPGPESEYTYTVIVRNDGDFVEENVIISIGYHPAADLGEAVYTPYMAWSTPFLGSTITERVPTGHEVGYGLSVTRLNPGEWVSLQAAWRIPAQVSVEVRSDTVTDSAFVG
jgi:hypothetical protein